MALAEKKNEARQKTVGKEKKVQQKDRGRKLDREQSLVSGQETLIEKCCKGTSYDNTSRKEGNM